MTVAGASSSVDPMRRTLCRLSFVVLLNLSLLLGGCGDDDNLTSVPGAATPTRTPTPSVTATSTPTQPPLTSAAVLQAGPLGVGVTTMLFEDTSRPTMANGTFPGSPTRKLVQIAPRAGTTLALAPVRSSVRTRVSPPVTWNMRPRILPACLLERATRTPTRLDLA